MTAVPPLVFVLVPAPWAGIVAPKLGPRNLGVDLGTNEQHDTAHIQPEHQQDHAPDGAIRSVVGGELTDVEPKGHGHDGPGDHGKGRARGHPGPALIRRRGQAVHKRDRGDPEDNRDGPSNDLPGDSEGHSPPRAVGDGLAEVLAEHQQKECDDGKGREDEGKADREYSLPPPGSGLHIQRRHDGRHATRSSPQGCDRTYGQQPDIGPLEDLAQCCSDQHPRLPRKNLADVGHQPVQQLGNREESKKRRQEQQRREEGEDEVVREGGAAVQDLVVADIGPHPLPELGDRQAAELPC